MMLSGHTKLAGVVGWPVAHSRSPQLHGHWLQRHGIDGAYLPLPVQPANLEAGLRGLMAAGFQGFNVTIPHKQAILPLIDRVDALATRIGAVNTVYRDADGAIAGTNSDAYGFLLSLDIATPAWRTMPGPAVILGAGGATRAILVALLDAGLSSIRLCNRTEAKAQALAEEFEHIEVWPWQARAEALAGAGLLVNTTSLGLAGGQPLVLDLAALPPTATVTDVVYTPLQTPLLQAAAERGNPTVDGLGMLLYQAVPGFEYWFGLRPEVDAALRQTVLAALS